MATEKTPETPVEAEPTKALEEPEAAAILSGVVRDQALQIANLQIEKTRLALIIEQLRA